VTTTLQRDIERLCALCGTSGFEEDVAAAFAEQLRIHGVASRGDNLGNVIGRIPGESQECSVLLAAHLDEVGLVVQYIEESGFLRFDVNGLVDPRVLPGVAVRVATPHGPRDGVVGMKPSHLVTEQDRRAPLEVGDLWIDLGLGSRAEIATAGIRVGEPVAYRPNFTASGDFLFSKSLDNRIGLAMLLDIARRYQDARPPAFDVYLAGTVQEEIGARGAGLVAKAVDPTIALVIDTVSAIDAVARPPQATAELGGGPVLRTLDFRNGSQGTVYSRKLRACLIGIAEANRIPHQLDVFRTWTDASTINVACEGIATQGIFIPRRYSHAPLEVASLKDAEAGAELLWHFLQSQNASALRELQKRF
jgi:putative aminopeptidase FrvX